MTDEPNSEDRDQDHDATKSTPVKRHVKNGRGIRKVVRNMMANMQYVLNDIQGIMGDIKTLVVQIDSVTDKIDAHCSKDPKENHVVTKPETIDCQTYWSRTLSKNGYKEMKDKAKCKKTDNGSSQGYEIPVFPASLAESRNVMTQRLDNPKKLSNVERWLIQESARHHDRFVQHPRNRTGSRKVNKTVKFGERYKDSVRKPFTSTDTDHWRSTYVPHVVRQPYAHLGNSQRCQFEIGKETSRSNNPGVTFLEPEYSNIKYEEINNDGIASILLPIKSKASSEFMPEPVTYTCSERSFQKQIRVYNSHYEEKSSNTDESPVDSDKTTRVSADKPTNEFNVVMPQVLQPKPRTVDTTHTKRTQPPVVPDSPRMVKHSAFLQNPSQVILKSSRPGSRTYHSIDCENHRYHSLESDLDSINDCNDPRCMTPDMDWSYLSLMGNGANKTGDRSSRHVYQTIGSPVFRRRKAKIMCNITKSISFQTSPDVVSKLICVENLNFATFTPDTENSDSQKGYDSFESNIVGGLEELSGSTVLNHIFCDEVSNPISEGYCGYYEAIVDAVLENVSGYSSLEDACSALENHSEIMEETYVGFDDDFFDDEWDIGLKPSSDYYFEDDIDFSLSIIPRKQDDFHGKYADGSEYQSNPLGTIKVSESLPSSQMESLPPVSKGNKRKLSPSDQRKVLISACEDPIRYDDVNILYNDSEKSEGNNILLQTVKSNNGTQFSFWAQTDGQAIAIDVDNSSTSSESGEAMASGSSNMSFGSADMALTPPDCEDCASSAYNGDRDTHVQQLSNEIMCDDEIQQQNVSITGANETMDKIMSESVGSAFREVGCLCENTSVIVQREPVQHLRRGSGTTGNECDISCAASLDDPITYNRNVNTWTAYAMVHVPADEISDSASDIINDNSINNSMTSSYFEADNCAVAQKIQGFVDT